MKIGPTPAPSRPVDKIGRPTPASPPVALDALGVAWQVINSPTTDAAWLALTDRAPAGGHYLAARLTACSSRVDEATMAVAKMLPLVRSQQAAVAETATALENATALVAQRIARDGGVPPTWTSRLDQLIRDHAVEVEELGVVVDVLADLIVEEFDALVAWDDVAHQAALVEPAWVEIPPGERAIPPDETSWARLSRIVAREIALVGGMELSDAAYDAHCALDATRPCEGSDLDQVTAGCRAAIRIAVVAHYGHKETTT